MDKTFLPHTALFDELQIELTQVSRDLPLVSSMLKWVKATTDKEALPINFGWMLSSELNLSHEKQVEKLSALKARAQDLSRPLKELMQHILQFSHLKQVEKALISLHKSYLEIPQIDNEMHLLYLGTDLFENKELLAKLLLFTEKLTKLQESSLLLKKAILDTLIQNLSMSLDKTPIAD